MTNLSTQAMGMDNAVFTETYKGIYFNPSVPTFNIEDIAHALGMNCRFNGHVSKFQSVAEHSIMVSLLMEEFDLGSPLEGLLHDAVETYLTDVPKPFKTLLPDWSEMDRSVERAMRKYFDLPPEKTDGCDKADQWSGIIEAYFLMPSKGEGYRARVGDKMMSEALDLTEQGWRPLNLYPEEAEEAFMRRYRVLCPV